MRVNPKSLEKRPREGKRDVEDRGDQQKDACDMKVGRGWRYKTEQELGRKESTITNFY